MSLSHPLDSLVHLLRVRADSCVDDLAFSFLPDGELEGDGWTFAELWRRAQAVAAWLQVASPKGDGPALLLYPSGLDFVSAFFGCLAAGVIAVPAYPPRRNRNLDRLQTIVSDSNVRVILSTRAVWESVAPWLDGMPALQAIPWLLSEEIPAGIEADWRDPGVDPGSIAFLQYTSGSTRHPRGVMVTHSNLLHNARVIKDFFEVERSTRLVSWLPLYHDMGLIGAIIEPLFLGIPCYLMAPATFVSKPIRWLRAINRYRANVSGGPNFAYELCVRTVTEEQKAELDLSCWDLAFNGAEPVSADTMARFTAAFASCGFRPESFYPCYGLAESTLLVTGGRRQLPPVLLGVDRSSLQQDLIVPLSEPGVAGQTLVGCGRKARDAELRIVDPLTLQPLPDDRVGEVWVAGPSVAGGYWNRPEESAQVFRAFTADDHSGPYLRTGDLGFLHGDELYITGRAKDLLILYGRNHYPQDIEHSVEACHELLQVGCGAAFSVPLEGEERLVVAQEVQRSGRRGDLDEVIQAIRKSVAEDHEVQASAVLILRPGTIPRTSSGKVQRHACRLAFLQGGLDVIASWQATMSTEDKAPDSPSAPAPTAPRVGTAGHSSGEIQNWLIAQLAKRLGVSEAEIDPRRAFASYGLDSVQAVLLAGDLESWLGRTLSPVLIYDYPTIAALASHLAGEAAPWPASAEPEHNAQDEPVAIVGMGCRFPGAAGLHEFWRLLRDGVDAVTEPPPPRVEAGSFLPLDDKPKDDAGPAWGGYLSQVDRFDAAFFGISPREAAAMDPQQRLLLEVAWESLEDAGLVISKLAGTRGGVFVGIANSDYGRLLQSQAVDDEMYLVTGNGLSISANRLSYLLDWHGPSLAVDTACSSSLVATHLACNSLARGECDLALVAGANLLLCESLTAQFARAGFMAADGRCKTFDSRADGYVRGEGVGVVVLKRLSQAMADGDRIYAVIRGSAVVQDGRTNGLTAPNGLAQVEVIERACRDAGIRPAELDYIEVHGTGTALGDPIEANALGRVLTAKGPGDRACWVGSVKTNVGHLEAAAGVAGLIKTALTLHQRMIPASLHFREANPHIPFHTLPIRVVQSPVAWPGSEGRRPLAGVSSFGFGGTNAHVILEAAPTAQPASPASNGPCLLPLSARDPNALRELARAYADLLESEQDAESWSLQVLAGNTARRRDHHDHRLALVAATRHELHEKLRAVIERQGHAGANQRRTPSSGGAESVFVFSGQGSQWPRMGLALAERETVFRAAFQECGDKLKPHTGWSLWEELARDGASSRLEQTEIAQPAIFAVQVALAALWRSWGVTPTAVLGHSMGEVAAAYVAGALSLDDAARLIAVRSRLMARAYGFGRMAAVELPPEDLSPYLAVEAPRVVVAAVNGPTATVLSGDAEAIERIVQRLSEAEVLCKILQGRVACHSHQMTPLGEELEQALASLAPRPCQVPMWSTVTGTPVVGEELTARYWHENLCRPVVFRQAIEGVCDKGLSSFVEIGPHPALGAAITQVAQAKGKTVVTVASLRRQTDEKTTLLTSLGNLYTRGLAIDWRGVYPERLPVVSLPHYPWQRERHWLAISAPTHAAAATAGADAAVALDGLLYELTWVAAEPAGEASDKTASHQDGCWLILADRSGVGEALAKRLAVRGEPALCVYPGTEWQPTATKLTVRPGHAEDYRRMLELAGPCQGIVHLWSLDHRLSAETDVPSLQAAQVFACESMLHVVQAVLKRPAQAAPRLWLATANAQAAGRPDEPCNPLAASLWGFGRSLAQEHPLLHGRLIDLQSDAPAIEAAALLDEELGLTDLEDQVAYRDGRRLVARLVRALATAGATTDIGTASKAPGRKPGPSRAAPKLRADASYLITGGLGGLGLQVARWLVARGARRLILMGRTPLPPRRTWAAVAGDSLRGRQIAAVRALESLGASVHLAAVDVADPSQLAGFLGDFAAECWPPLCGVIHTAGVLGDRPLAEMSVDELRAVTRAKLLGGWALHRALREYELDFFLLFSSASSILGAPGQAHYAAANASLDALASYARAAGVPALAVDWGPWLGAGMAARPDRRAQIESRGLGLEPGQALAAMAHLLAEKRAKASVAVLPAGWEGWRLALTAQAPPLLSLLAETSPAPRPLDEGLSRESLLAQVGHQRRLTLEDFVVRQTARVLGLAIERLDRQRALTTMGLDSLMALELKNHVECALKLTLPVGELLRGPSVEQLTDRLLEQLDLESAPGAIRSDVSIAGESHDYPLSQGQKVLQTRVRQTASALTLVPFAIAPREGDLEPAINQETIWFYDQLQPNQAAYNLPIILRLMGKLKMDLLRRTFDEVIARHEVLRTSYPTEAGRPLARIHPFAPTPLECIDLSNLDAAAREERVRNTADREARTAFDVARGPLWRYRLLRLGEEEHVLVLVLHHLVFDGWSSGVLVREVTEIYGALSAGRTATLPPLPIQYLDHAHSQRRWLAAGLYDEQRAYWQQKLAAAPPPLALPTDHPRPPVWSFRGRQVPVQIPADLSQRLAALAREESCSLFMLLLAAIQTLLHRHTQHEDICVGSPIANRNRAEIEGLIGYFVNTLVFRGDLSGRPTFRELLRRVRQVALEAYANQELPFEEVVRSLQLPRDARTAPLFQVLLVMQHSRWPHATLTIPSMGGLSPSLAVLPDNETSKFDLSLGMAETLAGLRGTLEYNSDLFEPVTIARMVEQLGVLLSGIVENPDCQIDRLPLLPESERAQLAQWNATAADVPRFESFVDLVEARVEATPEAIAAQCEAVALSYRELDGRANRLAHRLRAIGVSEGTLVALLAERDLDFLTAILAIFKAGSAYLPLDPRHPAERHAQSLRQSRCPVVLAAPALRDNLSAAAETLDADAPAIHSLADLLAAEAPSTRPTRQASANDLAYVIFTSGSTGRPKGAMITQGGMVNHLFAKVRDLELNAADVVAQTASQSFDISVWQFLAAMVVGGRTEIIRTSEVHDPRCLLQRVETAGVTVLEVVPSQSRALLAELERAGARGVSLRALRWLLHTGEALPVELARAWLTRVPRIPLVNAYGPTECSDDVTHHILRTPPRAEEATVPIGRPIANTQIYILDHLLQPVPIGVVGELCVGGDGVGLGYLHDEARTAAAFVPDPFSQRPGMRLYRTGDLARQRADGVIEFLGRVDDQVKLRGFRIELGEIEAVLTRHPQVGAGAVLASEKDQRLVAFVVPANGELPSPADLRAYLARRLPEYMVPSAFVPLLRLPLSANGKVDRKALPLPRPEHLAISESYVAPRTPTEESLARIWAEVLDLPQVGVTHNFFELGGHSLKATRVLARVEEAFPGKRLPLRTLFESPTIEAFAAALDARETDDAAFDMKVVPVPREGDLPLSAAQQGLWFIEHLDRQSPVYSIAGAVQIDGTLDVELLGRAFSAIVARHETLRTAIVVVDGQYMQRVSPALPVRPAVECLEQLEESKREQYWQDAAREEAARPFDLANAPLWRLRVFRLSAASHVLVWVSHHAISDGWSLGVLVRELALLYQSSAAGEAAPPAPLPIQYGDFTVWQQQWVASMACTQELAYWKERLAGMPAALELPTDRPRPDVQTTHGDSYPLWVPPPLGRALSEWSDRQGVTLFTTLLAAWHLLLARESRQDDFAVGVPVAGRRRVETEGLIGCFINMLALRVRIDGRMSFYDLARQVHETSLEAFAHQEAPLTQVVEGLGQSPDRSRPPLFQVMFSWHNMSIPRQKLGDFTWSLLPIENRTAMFDLELSLTPLDSGFHGYIEYSTDLFETTTIAAMADRFLRLLETVVVASDRPLADYLLGEAMEQRPPKDRIREEVP
jgi:amino acid adenylation domain-containing protein